MMHFCRGAAAIASRRIPAAPSVPTTKAIKATSTLSTSHATTRSFSFLWDVLSSGSLKPPNPILNARTAALPQFANVEPYHLTRATKQVLEEYPTNWATLQALIATNTLTADEFIDQLAVLDAPVDFLATVSDFYQQDLYPMDSAWLKAMDPQHVSQCRQHYGDPIVLEAAKAYYYDTADAAAAAAAETSENTKRALEFILKQGAVDVKGAAAEKLSQIRKAIFEMSISVQERGEQYSTRAKLEDLYNFLGLKTEEAKLMGYANQVELQMKDRKMSLHEIRQMHDLVASALYPKVEDIKYEMPKEIDMSMYLSLDGTLGGLFAVSRALFGIVVKEAEKNQVNGWYPDVRLFHLTDEDTGKDLGSFYLDPFRRPAKSWEIHVLPLTPTKVVMNCAMIPPTWSTEPAPIQMSDARSLFHEFGHVLELLGATHKDSLRGPTNKSYEASEVMSQFMEQWLFEESVLETLAFMSGAAEPIPKETMQDLKQQYVNNRRMELTEQLFMDNLELEYFLNDRGSESLVSMQHRIAAKYLGHSIPAKSDMRPLMKVFKCNTGGEHHGEVGHYRYLLGEIIAADLFNVFQQAGLENQEEMKRLGRMLKAQMIEPGAAVDMARTIQEFTGRSVSPQAFFDKVQL
jgi:Zn-dependent oligopeptidase